MKPGVRRAISDGLVSAGVLAGVVTVLLSIDPRMSEQVQHAVASASPSTVVGAGAALRDIGFTLFDSVRALSVEHAPLMIFVVVGTALVLFMVRT